MRETSIQSLSTWFLRQAGWIYVCYSWGFAPNRLGIAQELPIYGRTLGSLYHPWFFSEELKFTFLVTWETQGGERDFDLNGHLNNEEGVGKP